ncbi:glycoside hydrolase family 27 protein [Globicatella sulfidifaciens]|uniref:Alpha-galactosidase n=1 Tax=Globicatella sulfidifaciens DSM 15739 TaxID=1121925 RepID=A0A1T4JQ88_9LACT|nr:glycoside hydrolase family 27 protein [Globicatella sulfidifaciens]SJZ32402.1 Alpha-galactosidase [Globicatella sulfidifaciens DSM 15739]
MKTDFIKTPPMGWNSWDCYGASVTEEEVRENAKFMSENLKSHGWEYVVVDIQWSEPEAQSTLYNNFYPLCMDKYSRLIPAENRFPSSRNGKGFKELADYVHSLGLKFGIHIMRGIPRQAVHRNTLIKGTIKTARDIALNNICPWNSDMYGVNVDLIEGQLYYDSLFELYAEWGVDFVKVDDIAYSKLYHEAHKKEVIAIRKSIEKSGRNMVLSLSPGPAQLSDAEFFVKNAHMWRMTDDLWDKWESIYHMFEKARIWSKYVSIGSYPDCDMLPLGHIGIRAVDGGGGDNWTRLTKDEQYVMMSLWSIFGSPLMFGGILPDIDEFTYSLITNEEVLEMHRTVLKRKEIYCQDELIVWEALSEKNKYYGIFNLSEKSRKIPTKIVELVGVSKGYDIWKQKHLSFSGYRLNQHSVLLVKL